MGGVVGKSKKGKGGGSAEGKSEEPCVLTDWFRQSWSEEEKSQQWWRRKDLKTVQAPDPSECEMIQYLLISDHSLPVEIADTIVEYVIRLKTRCKMDLKFYGRRKLFVCYDQPSLSDPSTTHLCDTFSRVIHQGRSIDCFVTGTMLSDYNLLANLIRTEEVDSVMVYDHCVSHQDLSVQFKVSDGNGQHEKQSFRHAHAFLVCFSVAKGIPEEDMFIVRDMIVRIDAVKDMDDDRALPVVIVANHSTRDKEKWLFSHSLHEIVELCDEFDVPCVMACTDDPALNIQMIKQMVLNEYFYKRAVYGSV